MGGMGRTYDGGYAEYTCVPVEQVVPFEDRPVELALDMTVLATTRSPDKSEALERLGVDHVLIDDGEVAAKVRSILPEGVDTALELVGTPTLPDTLRATRVHGVVCFTGMLSNRWIVEDFYPIDYLPRGVRLTAYGGESADLSESVLQGFLDAVAAGEAEVPVDRVYRLDEIVEAHRAMEEGSATGKLVVAL
jgi:NADPH2:quinone reductase